MLDRGVLTINEVRRTRSLPDVPWGDIWAKDPASTIRPVQDEEPKGVLSQILTPPTANGTMLHL